MTSLFLLMVMKDGNVDAAFARFKSVMRTMPTFEVQFAATNKRGINVDADFIMDGRKRILFDSQSAEGRYILTITPSAFREVDWASKNYDIFAWEGPVTPVESRISDLPKAIPFWLRAGDLRNLLPKGASPKYVGKQTINGESCDFIRTTVSTPSGKGMVEFDVAPSGLLSRYYWEAEGQGGRKQFEWVLKNYRPLKSISASRFENRIPDGFMPFALPDHHLPVGVGKKPNLSGWVYSKAGTRWSAPKGQSLLFVLTSGQSLPGKNALSAVGGWRAELNAKHVVVAEASDATTADAAGGLLYNPDQRSVRALDVPATPMFLLIDSSGTLRNMWMGFKPAIAGKIHDDLLKAVAGLK